MHSAITRSATALLCVLAVWTSARAATPPSDPIFEGERRNVKTSDGEIRFHQPRGLYATLGPMSYVIGCQDGTFPDFGHLIPNEMGGVWVPPIKILDGYWLKISDSKSGRSEWITGARHFTTRPHECELDYGEPLPGLHVVQRQFCPQHEAGTGIFFDIENRAATERELLLEFIVRSDVRGVFDFIGDHDETKDIWLRQQEHGLLLFRDGTNDWFGAVGCREPKSTGSFDAVPYEPNAGKGIAGVLRCRITLPANSRHTAAYGIAGSVVSEEHAAESCRRIFSSSEEMIREKIGTMTEALGRSAVSIPDKQLEQLYDWNKVHIEWMVSELPHLGRYLYGGAVTYPFLFCDMYSIQALCAMGDHDLARSTLRVLREQSERANGNGRIIHEVSAFGNIGNRGNTQETAHYIMSVGKVFRWTGDIAFLREHYPYMQQGISWLLDVCDKDRNLIPEGNGIIEVQGLDAEVVDVACYTQQALAALAEAAAALGNSQQSVRYAKQAEILKHRIDSLFWNDGNGTYADFVASAPVAERVVEGAIRQLKINRDYGITVRPRTERHYEKLLGQIGCEAGEMHKRPRMSNCNWIMNIPLETGIAPPERALRQLDRVRKRYTGKHGLYISGVERDRVMTITNGVQAVCEARYGRIDEALWYMHRIADTFGCNFPGGIYEMTPDWGCPVIAWTSYGIAVPLVSYLFGVDPDAPNRTVILRPDLPQGWTECTLTNLTVGNNRIDYTLRRKGKKVQVEITDTRPGWRYLVDSSRMAGHSFHLIRRTRQ